MQARPTGVDPEDVVEITFEPPAVLLSPARREIVRADVRGGRPWFGQPKPRVLSFSLGPDAPPVMATFVQRPRIGRWLISLLGLVTVAGIFALVLSTVVDRLVRRDVGGCGAAQPGTDPARWWRRRDRLGDSELGERDGRRRQHRPGRRRRPGAAVLVGQRRGRARQRGDGRRRRLLVRPAVGWPLPRAVHWRRVRRAVVRGLDHVRRRDRRRGRRRPGGRARAARARRAAGKRGGHGGGGRPDGCSRSPRRAGRRRCRDHRPRRRGQRVGRRVVPLRGGPLAGELPALRREGRIRDRGA